MDFMSLLIKLLNVSISASWLVLAVIVFRFIFRKAPKSITVFLWALVAIRLICPISLESNLSLNPNAEIIPPEILDVDPHKGVNSTTFEVIENPVFSEYIDSEVTVDNIDSFQWDTVDFTVIWLIGVAVLILYCVISYLRIYLKVRQSVPLRENIFISDTVDTPFIFGIIRPRIYLPSDMAEGDMSYVIAHEKAHLKRRDYLWKPLGFLLLTVYWFNPVLWVAYILLCRDIELACDERVIKEMGAEIKKPYSMALINCSAPRKMISACPVAFGEVGVKKRIKAVLNYKKPAFRVIILSAIAGIVIGVCFMTDPVTPKTQVEEEFLWYFNPAYSAVNYGRISFRFGEEYDITRVEATSGSTEIYDRFYNETDGEKLVGWSPDITKDIPSADITVYTEKDGEEKVYKVSLSPEPQDEDEIGTYFRVKGENCCVEYDEWAVYTLDFGEADASVDIDLDEAVGKAIIKLNHYKNRLGECAAEGHIIMGTDKKGDEVKVYILEQFSTYGFENGWFLEQSGHSLSGVMTFRETEDGYIFLDAEYPRDGSLLSGDIKRMFPKIYEKRALRGSDKDRKSMREQREAYAKAYLKEIGREAKIGSYGDVDHVFLTDLGVSVEVSNRLSDLRINYNTCEVGYFEKVEEDGKRYIYRTSYLMEEKVVLYTKEVYGTYEVVERIEVNALTGNIISTNNSDTWFDAKVLDTEKNGDFVLVEPFGNSEEIKTADRIWVSLNVKSSVPVPDLYEGVYIRIMYDGALSNDYPAKISDVSAIYLLADVNYIGNEASPSDNREPTTTAVYVIEETLPEPTEQTPLISVGEADESYYYVYQSEAGDISSLKLYPEDKSFSFSLSVYSSYFPHGTYTETDDLIMLNTDDGKYQYVFGKTDGNLTFFQIKSSPVPKYKYGGANTEALPCIPDLAVFEFIDTLTPYFDKITADIDDDGTAEECTLGFGPTSGLMTFTFTALENGTEEYKNVFLETGAAAHWEFEKGTDGNVRVVSKDKEYGDVIDVYDIKIKEGNIELVSGKKVLSHYGGKTESEKFDGIKNHFEALKNFAFSYYTENKTADGDETTLQIADGKLRKLDDLKTTTIEIPDILEKSVAAVDNGGYDWIDITEDYVVFWSDELSTYGILFSEKPTKAIRAIKKNGYDSMDSSKIEKYWYEVGQLYG